MIASCNVPSGHILEQYTLPKSRLKISTAIKPREVKLSRVKKFRDEGTNCKYVIILLKIGGERLLKSKNKKAVYIKKRRER